MPDPGQMLLYDEVIPPLPDNSYRLTVETDVSYVTTGPNGNTTTQADLPAAQSYFDIEGPRFRLASTEVATVVPPRNGHGDFSNSVPHIALFRRTLPWERPLAAPADLPPVKPDPDLEPPNPLPGGGFQAPPWLALLVVEDGEYTILPSVQLTPDYIPASVLQALNLPSPTGVTCDLLQIGAFTLDSILPSLQELTLLCHARQVNVDDRELNVGSGDGWFSVVMSNRLPNPNSKCRACLVSLEQRTDLVFGDPPPVDGGNNIILLNQREFARGAGNPAAPSPVLNARSINNINLADGGITVIGGPRFPVFQPVYLVLLYSWQFETTGSATFEELMQDLDVSMFGVVANPGHPPIADTGHIQMQLQDKAGAQETVWYRGPLSPYELTRDSLGPYHCADQALRATPETGALDISYSAAFEAGRLLAAADGRLAQDLMRWRRQAYHVSNLADSLKVVANGLETAQPLDPQISNTPLIAVGATSAYVDHKAPLADTFGLKAVSRTVGFDPAALQEAWGLATPQQAAELLGANPGVLGATVTAPAPTARDNTSIDAVAADTAGLNRLTNARTRTINNIQVRVGEQP